MDGSAPSQHSCHSMYDPRPGRTVTVAERGLPVRRASSPHELPGPRCFVEAEPPSTFTETSHVPALMR
eukprot:scaffold27829_cov119-Isochrysis_galbana.AAC.4